MAFEDNVFVNCPFDSEYKEFLNIILFTIPYCGFEPQISETKDSGSVRLQNILNLIKDSRLSIHDLCRMTASKKGELARFNMPFEFGLDMGMRNSGVDDYSEKRCLVLDIKKHRYQASLSDMAGNDIEVYHNDAEMLIRIIRNWLSIYTATHLKGAKRIWEDYAIFSVEYVESLESAGFNKADIDHLPKSEYVRLVKEWIAALP